MIGSPTSREKLIGQGEVSLRPSDCASHTRMKILLALDSRPTNCAVIGLLDPHSGQWDRVQVLQLPEPFKRKGFRGCVQVGGSWYVVNSAALYQLEVNLAGADPFVSVVRTLRRPEWEQGERAAADLHHVHYSQSRNTLLVANSFMDAVDEVSLDCRLVRRHYLWDISPTIAEEALRREPSAMDLVHINHISERDGVIYLTLGNWNGTRRGKVVRFDNGDEVLAGLEFPHDGVFVNGDFYLTESGAARIAVYRGFASSRALEREPHERVPVVIRQSVWRESFQWVRGLGFSPRHLLCGVTQWRESKATQPQIPPRIAFFDRTTLEWRGDLFLPPVAGAPTPSLFSIHTIDDGRGDDFPFGTWPDPPLPPPPTQSQSVSRKGLSEQTWVQLDGLPLAFGKPGARELSREWHYPRGLRLWRVKPGWRVEPRWCAGALADGSLVVWAAMEPDEHVYLRTGRRGFRVPPERPELWALEAGKEYQLRVPVISRSGSLQVRLQILEYAGGTRIRSTARWLDGTEPRVRFKTSTRTECVRLALRFSDAGQITLGPLQLMVRSSSRQPGP